MATPSRRFLTPCSEFMESSAAHPADDVSMAANSKDSVFHAMKRVQRLETTIDATLHIHILYIYTFIYIYSI